MLDKIMVIGSIALSVLSGGFLFSSEDVNIKILSVIGVGIAVVLALLGTDKGYRKAYEKYSGNLTRLD